MSSSSLAQPYAESNVLEFRCLGNFAFAAGDTWRDGPARGRGRSFLQYLATHSRAAVSRASLIEALWPELDADACAHRLHLAVSGARAALRGAVACPSAILFRDDSYAWHPSVCIVADTDRFSACYAEGTVEAMREGIALYAGQFLAGDAGDWLVPFRTRYEHMYVTMLERLAVAAAKESDFAQGADLALAAVAADPAHEGATRLVMFCLAKSGRRSVALAGYDHLERYLHRWLSIAPTPETKSLRDQILAGLLPETIS